MNYEISVCEDVYEAGRDECGTPYVAVSYFVMAEATNGARLRHNNFFRGCKVVADEDGFDHFVDLRERAKARAEALADKIRVAGRIDERYWSEMDPAYGSKAYTDMDAGGYFAWRERAEEMGVI